MNRYRLVDPAGHTAVIDGFFDSPPTLKPYLTRRGWTVERLMNTGGWVRVS